MKYTVVLITFVQYFQTLHSWVLTNINYPDRLNKNLDYGIGDIEEANYIGFNDSLIGKSDLRFSLTYPGTKWCGPGDVADNFDDLGSDWRADKCCRAHDYCPDTIPGGDMKHNLTNDVFYTRLSCDCDEVFRRCLQDANTYAAVNIGKLYFNLIDTKCFRKDHPVIKCVKRGSWPIKKCLEYSYDTSSQKVYGWFDVPYFR